MPTFVRGRLCYIRWLQAINLKQFNILLKLTLTNKCTYNTPSVYLSNYILQLREETILGSADYISDNNTQWKNCVELKSAISEKMNSVRLFFKYDETCNRLDIAFQIDSLFSFVAHIHVWSQLFMSHLDVQHASKAEYRISNWIHQHCLHPQESSNCTWTNFKDYI